MSRAKDTKKIAYIKDCMQSLSSENLINLWNMFSDEIDGVYIYNNDEYFFNIFFENKPAEAVRATFYGSYDYNDNYAYINGYGNVSSFDFTDQENCPINMEALAEWCCERLADHDINAYFNEVIYDIVDAFEQAYPSLSLDKLRKIYDCEDDEDELKMVLRDLAWEDGLVTDIKEG